MQDASNSQLVSMARWAMRMARRCVSPYSTLKSRHDFTQPQLVACLVLKTATRNDYRGICELLTLAPALREAMGLEKVPHWTTLQKFMARAQVPEIVDQMLGKIVQELGLDQIPSEVVSDSTALQCGVASLHYQRRQEERGARRSARRGRKAKSKRGAGGARTIRQTVKVSVMVVCGAILPAALVVGLGSSSDMRQMPALMERVEQRLKPSHLLADSGYDAEWVHEVVRERWQAQCVIPPVIRTADGTIKTKWRAQMRELPAIYGRRWHVESFMSAFKRTMGSTVSSRSARLMEAEAAMKVLAYAIRR